MQVETNLIGAAAWICNPRLLKKMVERFCNKNEDYNKGADEQYCLKHCLEENFDYKIKKYRRGYEAINYITNISSKCGP